MVMLIAPPVFASVGTVVDGINRAVTDIKFKGTNTSPATTNTDGVLLFNLLLAGSGTSGGTSMTSLQTTVDVSYGHILKAINTTETQYGVGTLPDGKPGQILTIYITKVTTGTWVLTPTTSAQIQTVTFDAVGDTMTFWWVDDTAGWRILSQTACTIVQDFDGVAP